MRAVDATALPFCVQSWMARIYMTNRDRLTHGYSALAFDPHAPMSSICRGEKRGKMIQYSAVLRTSGENWPPMERKWPARRIKVAHPIFVGHIRIR